MRWLTVLVSVGLGSVGLGSVGLVACGGAPETKAPDACSLGKRLLAAKVGPELESVVLAEPTPVSQEGEKPGCAFVYVQHSEESAEELPEGETLAGGVIDQRIAFALYGDKGKVAVTLVEPATEAPGAVMVSFSTRDVTGDGRPELVVQEDSAGGANYRGLRIFATAPGQPQPRELFSQRLLVKTAEGLEIVPTWRTGELDGKRALFFDGAGTWRIFGWNPDAKVFVFDAAATAAKNPKPAPAEAPAALGGTAAPSTAAPGSTPAAPSEVPAGDIDLNLP